MALSLTLPRFGRDHWHSRVVVSRQHQRQQQAPTAASTTNASTRITHHAQKHYLVCKAHHRHVVGASRRGAKPTLVTRDVTTCVLVHRRTPSFDNSFSTRTAAKCPVIRYATQQHALDLQVPEPAYTLPADDSMPVVKRFRSSSPAHRCRRTHQSTSAHPVGVDPISLMDSAGSAPLAGAWPSPTSSEIAGSEACPDTQASLIPGRSGSDWFRSRRVSQCRASAICARCVSRLALVALFLRARSGVAEFLRRL